MLKLKKYLTLSALLLTLVGQMNAMDTAAQQEQVDAYIKEAQEAYKSGIFLTPHFNNIVCHGDDAYATHTTDKSNGYRISKWPYKNFSKTFGIMHDEVYKLGSCKEYFTTLVAIMNNEHQRQTIVDKGNDTSELVRLVAPQNEGNLVHMVFSGNLEKPANK